ncbi:hypothetical protein BDR04DRAFT_1119553 [Suillus decipiens]|nr:hypothetical protein BDR04DRAFT_1119553 [Suillus decipiens]
MNPPKSSTTVQITADLGLASQYSNLPGTVIELKGRKAEEKGDHYLQLSLAALKELANLLETLCLSDSDKRAYHEAYIINQAQYDDLVCLRDQLLGQKKSFHWFLINLFIQSDIKHFYKITYWNFKAIKVPEALQKNTKHPFIKAVFQGLSVEVHTEPEAEEVLAMLNQFANSGEEEEEVEDDNNRTELMGTTINSGVDRGIGSG